MTSTIGAGLGNGMEDIQKRSVDLFAGLSSIFTLAAISLERLHAIVRPLRHRQLTLRSYQASRIPSEVRERKDVHLKQRLLLITAVFVYSWLPFQVLPILMSFCISCQILPMILYVAKFLQYSNSFMNFLAYCFRLPDFRKALSRMLPQMQCRCSR
ncbi:adenosine receptor A1-like [Porites lutea]|uniref:adenosine receptor A1-like n=1 Tax=Porites lutea TaxID=51062 RepID=UPI003CC5F096